MQRFEQGLNFVFPFPAAGSKFSLVVFPIVVAVVSFQHLLATKQLLLSNANNGFDNLKFFK